MNENIKDSHKFLEESEIIKNYKDIVVEHAVNSRNTVKLNYPNGHARIKGPCGDTMQIWIKVENGIIGETCFWTDGCMVSRACGSVATDLAKGKTLEEAMKISQERILETLGELPEENKHCALLASNTLKEAVNEASCFGKRQK